jgi:hypothetical protein
MSAKSQSRRVPIKSVKRALDKVSERPRGRPRQADSDEDLLSRATAYTDVFRAALPCLWSDLAGASNNSEVLAALERADVRNVHEFVPLATLVRKVVCSRRFPASHDSRARFLADSLAARRRVGARTSRDLVGKLRQQVGRTGRILSVEMYVECSCGYKGQSRSWACPKCTAKIPTRLYPSLDREFE